MPTNTTSDILFSVILPTYNGEKYLRSALESVVIQKSDDLEVIAVDDGSSDKTLEILEEFRDALPLKIHRRAHIGNWVTQTNFGIVQSRGRYLSFLHQDDLWLPNRLAHLREQVRTYPDLALYLQPARFVDGKGKTVGMWRTPFGTSSRILNSQQICESLLVQNFIAMPAPLVRREALNRVGCFDDTLWFTADWSCWLALGLLGPWAYSPDPVTCFRLHAESQTVKGSQQRGIKDYREQQTRTQRKYIELAKRTGILGHDTQRLAEIASETNVALLSIVRKERYPFHSLIAKWFRLGPRGWRMLFRTSRLHERVIARLRIGLFHRASERET